MARIVWAFGVLHALIGSAVLFGLFHPLRDMLDAHAADLALKGSTLQAIQGIAILVLAARAPVATAVIAAGVTVWSAMLYMIVFTGQHPFDAAVPSGGAIMLLGWLALLVAKAPE
jgi:uncharacterized membrane protein YgdD (TMEM256/DUF423 family)